LWFAARDDSLGGSIITIEDGERGGTMIGLFISEDPGEPVLGDAIKLAEQRARTLGVPRIHTYLELPSELPDAFADRHGFHEHERWLHFELDTSTMTADLPAPPEGLAYVTLAARGDLAPSAHAAVVEAFQDMPGDFPRPQHTVDQWLEIVDGADTGRDHLLLLVDADDRVVATIRLARENAQSTVGYVSFLGVVRDARGRGLALALKRAAGPLAASLGITQLNSSTHENNAATIHLNRAAGWQEGDPHVVLERRLD
ncbi:MAG: family N-acetyltransferase, partial [Thermoleophilia bacterium]|nr:family N-acetyltransferase [Thermoleophilia bacterium]